MKILKLIFGLLFLFTNLIHSQDKLIYAKLNTGNSFYLNDNTPVIKDINSLGNKIYLLAIGFTPKKNQKKVNFGYEINFLGNSRGVGYTPKNSYTYILSNIYASLPITYGLELSKKNSNSPFLTFGFTPNFILTGNFKKRINNFDQNNKYIGFENAKLENFNFTKINGTLSVGFGANLKSKHLKKSFLHLSSSYNYQLRSIFQNNLMKNRQSLDLTIGLNFTK